MEEMGRVTGIKVVSHTHNEPGHGCDQCDSAGANCVRAVMAWHLQHGLPIDHAIQTLWAMQSSAGLAGMLAMVIEHDPRQKLSPSAVRTVVTMMYGLCTHTKKNKLLTQTHRFEIWCWVLGTVCTRYIPT